MTADPAWPRREPRATYRLQLHSDFGFLDAAEVVGYLADLGVSHVYLSPVTQAAAGSTHGYDVVDPGRVSDDLGGPEAHAGLCRRLAGAGLGQVVDVVPNHMAITRDNRWWWDVLEDGPSSRYAHYFDVDWDPPEHKLRDIVLLPVLGNHYGRVLEAGEIRVEREGAAFLVRYHEHAFPLSPRSLDVILDEAARRCGSEGLAGLAEGFGSLPLATADDPGARDERNRGKRELGRLLSRLLEGEPAAAKALDEVLEDLNRDPDDLDALLDRQNYRLAYWRTAGRELDYRRFFDIATLAGLRVEDERVFEEVHRLVLGWARDGVVDGLRIDHVDGLKDPEGYLQRLADRAPDEWVVVEKVLEPGEALRETWPVAGTTGYEFLNLAGGLFIDPAGEAEMTGFYASFTGEGRSWADVARESRHLVMRELLGSDLSRLTALLVRICERHRRHRDHTRHDLHEAVREIVASLPVYRTYVHPGRASVHPDDVRTVEGAVADASGRRPDLDPELFSFLRDLLVLRVTGGVEGEFVLRFQQTAGPVMAKGVEDTAFYVYNRLAALNDVGGNPGLFGRGVEEFHADCAAAAERWPARMLTTSTHDTKRSEDVRARLYLLSEIPGRWAEAVWRWTVGNEPHRWEGLPDRNAEYLLYQALVGAWPLPAERAVAYMQKAVREAKQRTSWTSPDPEYERALGRFTESVLGDAGFLEDLEGFVRPLVDPGRVNSLSLVLLKLTAPGVPDIYQGTELTDLSLVDPDNRRPVDYALRRRLLAEAGGVGPEEAWARREEGLAKLVVVARALAVRARRPEAFVRGGSYEPLPVAGPKAAHALGFARGGAVVTVVPRLVLGLGGEWEGTTVGLPQGRWRNELTGEEVAGGEAEAADLLARFPVALLSREGP